MKTIFLLLITVAFLSTTHAQSPLANTAWQGHAMAPTKTDIIFHFTNDSIFMYILPKMFIGETMVYTTKDSTFTWRKTSGNSPCNTTSTGTYTFHINGDELSMKMISDDCRGRAAAHIDEPFKKVDVPTK